MPLYLNHYAFIDEDTIKVNKGGMVYRHHLHHLR